ncbi:MAG: hypothetical protein A3D24_01045 [Candidatus Blackburnbacteria bacterium RIFCSPHIGHO2_02_FULL_39_13]|uniref:LytR/CpsA/Psr regulator C-terminal domain-containing protein n=1 Tax=Candidatus Blackburnbacteria bacterium RIFCSPLOWO2_01_FULL_40_20 TaxID=1797519 RepID=A0A1G1VFT1_9BACT|nr:MAG: hypothetical protein UT38_C0009G0005 [Microgenomates group bacterium GW2011_GWA2_39_19]OGY07287.1 MAG: hypothetical protein A2694_04225 [Candidatus Blackburnbacteria bacterium RIFCSPHIGHO2_01_FULL_40_17]OGY08047.1 MAG: hypothetical protein A3D24_01045 [Candidatus Blackburnbacteria bacterium RIFCSPHIGHO2_02_FULL_39_13]OGY14136.1 MAG: hypothetical protein A3A77_04725 [Candidatus Blackburnbacteria bacterium RIFCSPLOWO2_01_FULL_40_20]OGY15432.1 MAG: hypothetical protein A3I52_01850 [Candida
MPARRKKSSHFRFFSLRLVFVFILICTVILSWELYRSWKERIWTLDTRFTVVAATADPTIYSYSPKSGKIIVIKISEKTQVDVAGEYGKWLAGSLWELGWQEGKKGELLRYSLQNSLGLPIDGWIDKDGVSLFEGRGLGFVSAFSKAITSRGIKTNLDFFDRLNVLIATSKVGIGDRRRIDLETQGVLKRITLADGEEGLEIVPDQARVAFEPLRDDTVFAESKRVVVINSSDKSGLASEVGRILSTLGTRVVGTQTNKDVVENCVLRGLKSDLETVTAKKVAEVFGCDLEEKEPLSPTDFEIILGENFAKNY